MPVATSRSSSPRRLSARELLAKNLLRLRRARGWSQETLAHECGLHRTYIGHIERLAQNASVDSLERIALGLKVEVHELLVP